MKRLGICLLILLKMLHVCEDRCRIVANIYMMPLGLICSCVAILLHAKRDGGRAIQSTETYSTKNRAYILCLARYTAMI